MGDKVYKMLKKALKNENVAQEVLERFHAINILNINRDWDWGYEEAKCSWVNELVQARTAYTHRSIRSAYKQQMKKTPYYWYDEFNDMALNIIKSSRKRKYGR